MCFCDFMSDRDTIFLIIIALVLIWYFSCFSCGSSCACCCADPCAAPLTQSDLVY